MEHGAEWIEKSWSDTPLDLNDTLVAEFRIPARVVFIPSVIRVEFFWLRNRADRYILETCEFNEKTPLSYTFANTVTLDGWLKGVTLFECGENDNGGVFGNIHLSESERAERWHYEGMMITFRWGGGFPPKPLPPPPEPLPPPGPVPMGEVVRQSEELFPYIYMRSWPRISDRDLELHFVDYADGPSPPGPLYSQLKTLRDTGGRAAMEQLAVDYINGDNGWGEQFVAHVALLPGVCGHFWELEAYARDLHERDLNEVIATIAEIIQLPEDQWAECLASAEYLQTLNRVQDSYFALVITLGYDQWDLQGLTATLIAANLFTALVRDQQFFVDPAVFRNMARASIILPRNLFPLPPYLVSPPSLPDRAGWIEPYAIGDLQMVRHRLMRYEPGEIAAIANVLKGERREIKTRNLLMASETVLDESLVDKHLNREDLARTSNLVAATEKTIADTVVVTDYDSDKGFKTTYGPPSTVTFEGSWSVENKGAAGGEPAKDDVARFAKNILNRTVNRVRQQIHRVRRASSTNENEETVVSVFDNVGGDRNIRGIYRWLNKVYRVSVAHYGTRLMMEFQLKDPAARYILNELKLRGIDYAEPLPPEHFEVNSYEDITPDNYASLAAYYGVTDLEPPPLATRTVSTVLTANQTALVSLLQGYQAEKAEVKAAFPAQTDQFTLNGLVGIQSFSLSAKESGTELTMSRELDAVPVSLTSVGALTSPPSIAGDCYLNVEIVCVPTTAEWDRWQIATYAVLLKGYHRRKAAYYQRVASRNGGTVSPPRSSLACRRIERSVLKEGCMGLLLDRCRDLVGDTSSPVPLPSAVNKPRYLSFFEDAFEWREMTYDFCLNLGDGVASRSWASIGEMAGDDELFARFLQAGQARVMVPASPEYTLKVLYYLSSAMIMPGANGMTPVHFEDVSIVDELQKLRPGSVEACQESVSWEVLVPTTMQVLQESDELPGGGKEYAP